MNTKKNIRVNTKKNKSTKRCNKPVRKIKKSGGNRSIRKYKSKKKYTIKKGGNTGCPTVNEHTSYFTTKYYEIAENELIDEEVGTYFIIQNYKGYLLFVKSNDGSVKMYVIEELDDGGYGIDYEGSTVFKTKRNDIEELKQKLIEEAAKFIPAHAVQRKRINTIKQEKKSGTLEHGIDFDAIMYTHVPPKITSKEGELLMEIFGNEQQVKFICFNPPPIVDRRSKPAHLLQYPEV